MITILSTALTPLVTEALGAGRKIDLEKIISVSNSYRGSYDPRLPYLSVSWPSESGMMGTLNKQHVKSVSKSGGSTIEPFAILEKFQELGATANQALNMTIVAGAESAFDGKAFHSGTKASGLFQGIQKFGWPSIVSSVLADHVPMMKKMLNLYKNKDFATIYANHFTPRNSKFFSTAEASVFFGPGDNDAMFGQYLCEFSTGETATNFALAGFYNLCRYVQLVDNHLFNITINLPDKVKIAVATTVGGGTLSHYEEREPPTKLLLLNNKNTEFVFNPKTPVKYSAGLPPEQKARQLATLDKKTKGTLPVGTKSVSITTKSGKTTFRQ